MSTNKSHPCRAAAMSLILLSCIAGSAHAATEVKVPRLQPAMQDIKTPAPPRPYKEPISEALPVGPLQLDEGQAKPAPRPAGTGFLAGLDQTRVSFDQPGDGAIWAVGDRYKASFDADGTNYIPFFGSRAPRSFPVHLRIDEITIAGAPVAFDASVQPVREGNRIVFHRGLVDELYELSPDSIEQSFVFESMSARGELLVRLAVDSELAPEVGADGLVFAGELGSVRYSNAFSFDEREVRSEVQTAIDGDTIILRVPAERVADARGALVIDPVLSTITIDNDVTEDDVTPDVAYDASYAVYLVVMERTFAADDHDVYSQMHSSFGSFVSGTQAWVDTTSAYWASPKVADNGIANQFLIVAQVGAPSGGARTIRGRTREASSVIQGSQFTISGSESGDKHSPDVGGDPYLVGPTYYAVVWQRDNSDFDTDVHGRLVRDNATLFGASTLFLSNSAGTLDHSPSISKTDGQGPSTLQRWNIAWTRADSVFDGDLYAMQLDWDGSTATPVFAVDTTSASTVAASATSLTEGTPRRWLLAYSRNTGFLTDSQLYGRMMQDATTIDTADLTVLSGSPSGESQLSPSADCDGAQFVVAHSESDQTSTDRDIYVSTFSIFGDQLVCPEGHVALALSTVVEDQVEIVCTGSAGGPKRRTFAAWHQQTGSANGDIEGALYETGAFTVICQPGLDGVDACPCGNAPSDAHRGCNNSVGTGGARLTATGDTSPDTVLLTASDMLPNGMAVFLQGKGTSDGGIVDGVVFGDGVLCIGGQLLRLGIKTITSGSSSFPGPFEQGIQARSAALGDTILPGTKRYYQTYYRDSATYGCAFPSTFNISSGVQIDW